MSHLDLQRIDAVIDRELTETEQALLVSVDVMLNALTILHPQIAPVLATLFEQHQLAFEAAGRTRAADVLGFMAATRAHIADGRAH